MRTHGSGGRAALAVFSMAALLVTPGGALAAWMQLAATRTSTTAAGGDWPRRSSVADGAQVVVYEPQIASWDDQKLMTLYAAVSYTPTGGTTAQLGTIMAEADTRVSVAERLVDFSSFRILQSHFPNASKDEATAIAAAIKASMPVIERVLALDRVLAYVDASRIRPKNVDGVKADPPAVFYSTRPAIIVNIDGDPIWSPIQGNDLRFAVNTNWDLFEHAPSKTFYLRHDTAWLKAEKLSGPWTAAGMLPGSFAKLPVDANWAEVRAALPGRALSASALPTVFASTTPGELILLQGEPQYLPVPGTGLQWVRNTESDLFRVGIGGPVYLLVAGRWFSSPGFAGPWAFATLSLPADFAKIPLGHERSRVLASVPGTAQAAEAVLLAQVPQTARVSKKMVKAPDVSYLETPEFEPIAPTTVARATNTDKDIFKIGDLYYMCFEGVWFMARSPSGPWEVTGSVPQQIYEIPVSSPSHHVTYVTVEEDDDDWVVFAAAAAYTGVMVAWGCAVWGTGFYYPPYVRYGGFYPAYFPHYPTYGYGARYNPWTGSYGRGAAVYGPYGGAGVGARYNPRTGTYARGAAAYGPAGARAAGSAYNPRTGAYGATRQGSSVYGSWGATGVGRGDQWASTARVTTNATGTTTRATRTSGGGAAVTRTGPQGGFVGTSGGGNVYAGRDGSVYRKQGEGWQKYDSGGWSGVQQTPQAGAAAGSRAQPRAEPRAQTTAASPTIGQLDRDAAARDAGAQRTRDAATVRSGSTSTRSGSYRPSGGGSTRGGGGARGGGRRR
jgi:hypothetical protein